VSVSLFGVCQAQQRPLISPGYRAQVPARVELLEVAVDPPPGLLLAAGHEVPVGVEGDGDRCMAMIVLSAFAFTPAAIIRLAKV